MSTARNIFMRKGNKKKFTELPPDEYNLVVEQFMQICRENDIIGVEKFLSNKKIIDVDCVDDDENTPLQIVSAFGHSKLAEILLKNGADVKKCNIYGFTPLLHAAYNGHDEIIILLIKYRSFVHKANVFGATALHLAVKQENLNTVRLLIDKGADVEPTFTPFELSPLMIAVIEDHVAIARILLDNGADPNKSIESTGYTPLMFAVLHSQLTVMVQLLLDCGAEINVKNVLHQTSLDLASGRHRRNDLITLLEQKVIGRKTLSKTIAVPVAETILFENLPEKQLSRQKEWWKKRKSKVEKNLRNNNIPSSHENCIFMEPEKTILNSNLIFGPTRASGYVVPANHSIEDFRDPESASKKCQSKSTLANSLNSLDTNLMPNGKMSQCSRSYNSIRDSKLSCALDFGGFRSLAMYHASRMRPTKCKPTEPVMLDKYHNFVESLNLNLDTIHDYSPLPSPSSPMSTKSFVFPAPFRKRTPHLANQANQLASPVIGAYKKKDNRRLLRPNSYHDGVEIPAINITGPSVDPCDPQATSTLIVRKHSFQNLDGPNSNLNLNLSRGNSNLLPITPTRKTFGYSQIFNNIAAPGQILKFNSTPQLTVTTPHKRSFHLTVSSANGVILNKNDDYMENILKEIAAISYSNLLFDDDEPEEIVLGLDIPVTLNDGDLRDLGFQDAIKRNEILKIVRQVNFMIERKRKRRVLKKFFPSYL